MTSRFSDPIPGLPAAQSVAAFSVAHVLSAQKVPIDASAEIERGAIAQWLKKNTPSDALRRSIERAGFGDLLRDVA